jgi:hypothetical protein
VIHFLLEKILDRWYNRIAFNFNKDDIHVYLADKYMDITLCLTYFKTLDVETYYKFKTTEEKYEKTLFEVIRR